MDDLVQKLETAQALLAEEINQLQGGDLEHFMAKRVLETLHSSWAMLTEEVKNGLFDEDTLSSDMLIDNYQACINLLNTLLPNVMNAADSLNSVRPDSGATTAPKL